MQVPGHPRIDVDPEVCGGRPRVAGTRLRVLDILGQLATGASVDDVLGEYPFISADDIRACLAYAAEATDHRIVLAAE